MSEQHNQPGNRDRAIIEAGRLIDALTNGNGDLVKACWYKLNRFVRPAWREIRQQEGVPAPWTDSHKAHTDTAGVG